MRERSELRRQDQVDEDDRQEQRLEHVLEHDLQLLGVAAGDDVVAGRQVELRRGRLDVVR